MLRVVVAVLCVVLDELRVVVAVLREGAVLRLEDATLVERCTVCPLRAGALVLLRWTEADVGRCMLWPLRCTGAEPRCADAA